MLVEIGEELSRLDEDVYRRGDVLVVLTSEAIGSGDRELGRMLAKNFIYALVENVPAPDAVIFLGDAVRFAAPGSDVLETLRTLENQGVELLLCSTSLSHHELDPEVGLPTNMYAIVEMLFQARKAIIF